MIHVGGLWRDVSPFFLNATVMQSPPRRYQGVDTTFVERLGKFMYVDDIVSGAESSEDAHKLYEESKSRLQEGGFTPRKFFTYSSKLNTQSKPKSVRLLRKSNPPRLFQMIRAMQRLCIRDRRERLNP